MRFIHTAECKNLLNQIFCSFRGMPDFMNIVCDGFSRRHHLLQHFCITHDGGQDVVEVVGDSACKRPDGFKSLRLA